MHKATIVTLSGIAFYLEEGAFTLLENYLTSVGKHFSGSPDKQEIISDIENRFAEYFADFIKSPTQAITRAQVQVVIEKVGAVEDFDDADSKGAKGSRTSAGSNEEQEKRLYRDTDTQVVAGVCSGLGAYFELDPVLFRLIFGLLAFVGGSGFIIYFVFWVAVPEAKTADDRLRMKGKPTTLSSIADQLRTSVQKEDTKNFLNRFGAVVRQVWNELGKILGFVLVFAASIGLAALAIGTALSIISPDYRPILEESIIAPLGATEFALLALGVLLIAALPLIGVLMIGNGLIKQRPSNPYSWISLTVLWFIAATCTAAYGSVRLPEVRAAINRIETSRDFTVSSDGLSALTLTDTIHLTVVPSETTRLELRGLDRNLDRVRVTQEGSVLKISRTGGGWCFVWCWQTIQGTLYTPSVISKVSADTRSAATLETGTGAKILTVSTEDAARVTLQGTFTFLDLKSGDASAITATNTTSEAAKVRAQDASHISIGAVTDELTGGSEDAASIVYTSAGTLSVDRQDAASIRKR